MPPSIAISVIIPVINEAAIIGETLAKLSPQLTDTTEVIVVDGHPDTTTLAAITDPKIITLNSAKGRSIQMNAGATAAKGHILVFLHADTILPQNALANIRHLLAKNPSIAGGAFDLSFNTSCPILGLIGWVASKRSRFTRVPFGDQALFIRKNVFETIGQYPEIPLMEDVLLMQTLKAQKYPIHIFKDKIITSPRRWEKDGRLRRTLRNWKIQRLYKKGTPPETLAQLYDG